MKAVHFGAGNIGRGFVGLLLHEGGYDLVFSDVSAALVAAINDASSYTVHEVGEGGVDKQVTNFRAIDSSVDAEALVDEIATADVVTTAVGPTILKFVPRTSSRDSRCATPPCPHCRSWRARTRSGRPTSCAST